MTREEVLLVVQIYVYFRVFLVRAAVFILELSVRLIQNIEESEG